MIKLDTSTYQERFQRAIDEWKLLSHNEEVYESDVSYTLLEMQTMLTDMLYYYMESVTSQHKKKYEKLLCKQETERSPISIPFQMQVDIPCHIHTGQQFKKEVEGGIVCFESMHAYNLQPNSFLAIHYQDEQHEEDISELLRYIEGTYIVENKQEAKIYFELEHALPIQKQIAFYICVEKNRNPVPYFQKNTSNSQLQEEKYTIDMQQFDIQMADITWQYESIHGWQDIEIIKDDTKGFLVSGEVVFQIGKQMKTATYNNMQTYRLRIIMKHMHYDKPPGLQSIWMNTILVNAQECDTKTFNFQNDGVCSVHIADDIAYANTTLQYVNEQGHWITHDVSKKEMEEYCCFTWHPFPIPASSYRIVAQRSTLQDIVSSFDTTGISMQKIDIETGSGYATLSDSCKVVCCRNHETSPFYRVIEPIEGLQDWVGNQEIIDQFKHIIFTIEHKVEIKLRMVNKNRTFTILFHGPSGTGKSLAASILAKETGLPLWQIDLSNIMDKYIGESEKHLRKIFQDAKKGNCILLFDEADVIFAKRTNITSSNDKYANSSTAYLLQELENYEGVVILTSNYIQNFDDAFLRRIQYIIRFPLPDEQAKIAKWRQCLCGLSQEDLPIEELSKDLQLTLSQIETVCLNAMIYAIEENVQKIMMRHLLKAVRQEYQKKQIQLPHKYMNL